jgi:hypothetical protein
MGLERKLTENRFGLWYNRDLSVSADVPSLAPMNIAPNVQTEQRNR